MINTKYCEGCKGQRDMSDFYNITDKRCRDCKQKHQQAYRLRDMAIQESIQLSNQKNKRKLDGILYRKCDRCEESRPLTSFRLVARGKYTDRSDYCKECEKSIKKEIRGKQKQEKKQKEKDEELSIPYKERVQTYLDRRYTNNIFTGYGVTYERYQEMLNEQNGLCAICRNPPEQHKRLVVDHDHKSGYVRGLLCEWCNFGLGWFRDDPEYLLNAIEYLKKSKWEY
jgi:hypothetical protein